MGLIDFFKEKLNKIFNKTKLLPEAKEPIEEINFEKEIINKINPSWSEIEKARFIQVKLCQYVNFDPELNLYEIVDKEYQEIYNREFDIEHITKTEITCKSWGRIYQELLNRVGITDVIVNTKQNFILKTINLKDLGFHESIQYLRYMFEALLDEKDLYYEEYSEKLKRNTHHSRIGGCNIYTKAKKGLDFENIFWVRTGKDEYEYYILDLKNR